VISLDAKKKLVGDFANGGKEDRPQDSPLPARSHDFMDDDLGKAIRYGSSKGGILLRPPGVLAGQVPRDRLGVAAQAAVSGAAGEQEAGQAGQRRDCDREGSELSWRC